MVIEQRLRQSFPSIDLILLLALAFVGIGCVSVSANRTGFSTASITGDITVQAVDRLLIAINGEAPVRTLRVNSGGGDAAAAVRLGRAVAASGIDLIVDGVCLSACANSLLPAAHSVSIVRGSVVGVHTSNISWALFALESSDQSLLDLIAADARDELLFLEGVGGRREFLICAEDAVQVSRSVVWREDVPARGSRYSMWILNEDDLTRFGVNRVRWLRSPSGWALESRLAEANVSDEGWIRSFDIENCLASAGPRLAALRPVLVGHGKSP